MKLLPFENITYKTRLKEDEVIKRLEAIVDNGPRKIVFTGILSAFNSPKSDYQYYGKTGERTFKLQRIITYRNSFLPNIKGTIEDDFVGTTIKVKMRLNISAMVFMCIWCGAVGFACVFISGQMISEAKFDPAGLIPFGMLLFAYGLVMGGFKYESNKSKKDLKQLFEAEIVEE